MIFLIVNSTVLRFSSLKYWQLWKARHLYTVKFKYFSNFKTYRLVSLLISLSNYTCAFTDMWEIGKQNYSNYYLSNSSYSSTPTVLLPKHPTPGTSSLLKFLQASSNWIFRQFDLFTITEERFLNSIQVSCNRRLFQRTIIHKWIVSNDGIQSLPRT